MCFRWVETGECDRNKFKIIICCIIIKHGVDNIHNVWICVYIILWYNDMIEKNYRRIIFGRFEIHIQVWYPSNCFSCAYMRYALKRNEKQFESYGENELIKLIYLPILYT